MRAAAAVLGLLTALVCSGCGFKSTQTVDAPPSDDAAVDASGEDARFDGPDACASFSRQFNTCGLPLMTDLSIGLAATYNTSTRELRVGGLLTGTMSASVIVNGQPVDAILVRNLTIATGVTLRAAGDQPAGAPPLVIVAGGNVTLEDSAAIDISNGGAGAVDVCSNTPPVVGQNNSAGSGGGGGGAYGGAGGDGSDGNGGSEAAGGDGGKSVAMSDGLRGGCSGARGGVGSDANSGAPGRGGGAMLIVAASGITLGTNAVLQAGGGGGGGGTHTTNPTTGDGGGGGGGSGGLIRLEAPSILAMNARIVANGGGGGEGSSSTEAGNSGSPGSTGTGPAAGGSNGAADGADGGQGGARTSPAGSHAVMVLGGGGGGGGGSVGYIHILSSDAQLGADVSPAPVVMP